MLTEDRIYRILNELVVKRLKSLRAFVIVLDVYFILTEVNFFKRCSCWSVSFSRLLHCLNNSALSLNQLWHCISSRFWVRSFQYSFSSHCKCSLKEEQCSQTFQALPIQSWLQFTPSKIFTNILFQRLNFKARKPQIIPASWRITRNHRPHGGSK